MDLEKAYDTIGMVCGRCKECIELGGILLKAVQSFYIDSRACVWVGNDVSGF